MMEDPMVSSEPMSDMTNARKGTQQAVPKQANAMDVRTKILLRPSDMPAATEEQSLSHNFSTNAKFMRSHELTKTL